MDQLEGEILQYEAQLEQVLAAASELPDGPQKESLCALEEDLRELITLSKIKLKEVLDQTVSREDPLDAEYNLFRAELDKLNPVVCNYELECQTGKTDSVISDNIKEELEDLKGNKCQAPFIYKWTNDVTYHNAFVSHVPSLDSINGYDDIKVKVMFTNPTHIEMLPCPYYLEGKCKFDDKKCKYSHGELVLLSSLKEYREPIFSNLCPGHKVFAKQDDGLWYRASVIRVTENDCDVKFESNSKEEQIPLYNILPLDPSVNEDSSAESDENDDISNYNPKEISEAAVRRVLNSPPGSALGEWEKFTKGFGSKIMAKMGYIHGSGLGKDGRGRVEPVSAVILPAGKSLDHCMMLKEKAGNDQDLFKAEKKMKQLQKKHEQKLKKLQDIKNEKKDIFTFINTKLDQVGKNCTKSDVKNSYTSETNKNLNVASLQLYEEEKRIKKEIKSLNESLARHKPHSPVFNIIKEKLAHKEIALSQIHATEIKIKTEQDQRRDRKKLTVF